MPSVFAEPVTCLAQCSAAFGALAHVAPVEFLIGLVDIVILLKNGPKWVLQIQLKICLSFYGFRPRISVKNL